MTSTQYTIPISASGYTSDLDELEEDSIINSDIDFTISSRINWDDDYVPLRRKKFIEDEHPYL